MNPHVDVIRLERDRIDPEGMRSIGERLRRGEIVAARTDTVYGLLAVITQPAALARLTAMKRRSTARPFLMLARGWKEVRAVTSHLTPVARRLAARYWPGPMTLVLPAHGGLPSVLTAAGPTVAVRVPADPVLAAILEACGSPLAAPSANRSGEAPARSAAEVVRTFGNEVDLVLDGGEVHEGVSSTIVDCTKPEARVLRVGSVVPEEQELAAR